MEGDRALVGAAGVRLSAAGGRLAGAAIAGALLAAMAAVAAGFGLRALGLLAAAETWRGFLVMGGWLWLPLWGAAVALLLRARAAESRRERLAAAVLGTVLALLPLVARPAVPPGREGPPPRTARAKIAAFRRWAYRSPADVARILPYARDPDPLVREEAVLALGVNRVVTDIEHATPGRPATLLGSPVRDSLRAALEAALGDPVETVRGEAARALWKAPRCFGPHPAAAGTLAAILDRARRPAAVERMAWLALDAAAGAPDSGLKSAAARFAAATADSDLARAARQAAAWPAAR